MTGGVQQAGAEGAEGVWKGTESWSRGELAMLYRLKTELDDATNVLSIVDALTETCCSPLGATNAAVGLVRERDNALHVYQGAAATAGTAQLRVMDLDEPTPMTDVIHSKQPLIVRSFDEFAAASPKIAARIDPEDVAAMPTYPLVVNGHAIGSIFFRFGRGSRLTESDLPVMGEIALVLTSAVAALAEREAAEAFTAQLQQSNRDLENFAAVVAHDLSAPVRRIGSFLTLLRRELDPLPEKAARRADIIANEVNHLSNLLSDTLSYAQVGDLTARRQLLDLQAMMDQIVAQLAESLEETSATVRFENLPTVDVAPVLVTQVFTNLVENAIKYRHPDRPPVVHVHAETEESINNVPWWRVSVSDNGVGIDGQHLDDIFAMFMRVPSTEDRPGTGVGLAFVRRVVEGHGGSVEVNSVLGEGTTFDVMLPGRPSADVL